MYIYIFIALYLIVWGWCIWELVHAKEVDKDDPNF